MNRPPAASDRQVAFCDQCGSNLTGPYCGQCGGPASAPRLELRAVLGDAVRQVVELDLPIVRTAIGLTRRPGQVVQSYISGRRGWCTSPIKYALLTTALLVAMLTVFDVDLAVVRIQVSGEEAVGRDVRITQAVRSIIQQYFNVFTLLAAPCFALTTRWLFRRSGLNLAEHLVFGLFLIGQTALLRALLAPFGALEHPAPRIVLVVVEFAYFVWAGCVVFERGVAATVWRMLIARLVLGVATVIFAAIGAIAILAITQPELLSGP